MVQIEPGLGSKRHGALVSCAKAFWNSGAALIATAAFLFSLTGLSVKLIGDDIPTFQVVLVPALACFIATTFLVRYHGLRVRSKAWRVTSLTLLRGLLGATCLTCFYLAIDRLPLQDAVTLFFCSPVLAALFEFLVTGESPGWGGAAASLFTVAGVVLVSQPDWLFRPEGGLLGWLLGAWAPAAAAAPGGAPLDGPGSGGGGDGSGGGTEHLQQGWLGGWPLLRSSAEGGGVGDGGDGGGGDNGASIAAMSMAGALLATVAAATNAAAFVAVRLLRGSQHAVVLTWWYHGVVVAVASVPLALGYPAPAVLPSPRGAGLLAAVFATQFCGQLLLNRGFSLESATRGSAINVLQVLFSFVWDVAVLGDTPGLVSMAGSSLVAAGVLFVALSGPKRGADAPSCLAGCICGGEGCAACGEAGGAEDRVRGRSAAAADAEAGPEEPNGDGGAGGGRGCFGGMAEASSTEAVAVEDGAAGLRQPLLSCVSQS